MRRPIPTCAVACGMAALLLAGCAAKQQIPLDCLTQEVKVYVDGRLLEENPDMLELSAEDPHKLFVKRPGQEPQLVVLDTTYDDEGRPVLEPADVCAVLVPVPLERELTIEAEDDEPL